METISVTNQTGGVEQPSESLAALRQLARKAALASVGAMALAYDAAKTAAADGAKLVDKAEARGEQVQHDAARQVNELENQTTREVKSLQELVTTRFGSLARKTNAEMKRQRSSLEASAEQINEEIETASATAEMNISQSIQRQVERVLTNLGIPTRAQLEMLSREIQALNTRFDEQLAQRQVYMQESMPDSLIAYDTLNAREIIALLPGLTVDQLETVRLYEIGHANRVTVLREIDEQIKQTLAVA